MRLKEFQKAGYILLALILLGVSAEKVEAASPSLTAKSVKIGKTISIKGAGKGASYQSEDPSVAYVNQKGVITGKKKGQTIITVKKKGSKQSVKLAVTVTNNHKLPAIPVCYDETELLNEMLSQSEDGKSASYSAYVKNLSKKGTIKKIEYKLEITVMEEVENDEIEQPDGSKDNISVDSDKQNDSDPVDDGQGSNGDDGTDRTQPDQGKEEGDNPSPEPPVVYEKVKKKITLSAEKIAAGKKKKIHYDGIAPDTEVKLIEVKLYSGNALVTWNLKKGTGSLSWGTKDKKAPVISGFVGKNSYNLDDVCMVAYSDQKYNFKKYIKAVDDRDEKVNLKVDTSKINWKKKGTYEVIYTASDAAGNSSKAKAKVQVRPVSQLDRMADTILKRIVKESWSETKKVKAIYNYMKRNYGYVDNNDHASWERSAERGLKYKRGNCFMYYSVSRLLLTRCGIPNLTITRSQGHGHHWWNLVYVQGGWYHFDATPRSVRAVLCLLTDKQLSAYSRSAYNSHIYNSKIYPKRATKVISPLIRGRNTF